MTEAKGEYKGVVKQKRLTKRQRIFIDEYLKSGNATKSALAAGYSPKTAYSHGARLLKNVEIAEAIATHLSASHMSAAEVLDGIADIARGNMADLMDITTMGYTFKLAWRDPVTNELIINPKTKLIKKIKQKVTTFIAKKESDEDREVIETELELYSAFDAKVQLGKFHKLFNERVEHTGADGGAILITTAVDTEKL
jgi:phage terminase small subunit